MRFRLTAVILLIVLTFMGCAHADDPLLTVTFFSVGKADAILLQTENAAVLIDAATNSQGDDLVDALCARGVEALDLLIITHFDKDHVGGADKVLSALPVARVLEPDYTSDSKQTRQYREALADANLQAEALTENISFVLDGVAYVVDVANASRHGKVEENDLSLVVFARCGEVRFLFAGDAERPRLEELLEEGGLSCDLLKVPHHGVYEKNSPLFFAAASAKYAVITSSAKEPEEEETVLALELSGSEVLLTREGTIVATTNGQIIDIILE